MGTRQHKSKRIAAQRRDASRRHQFVALLGALVVLTTAFALMVPALSLTRDNLACTQEEHTHTAACYQSALTCGQAESAIHHHTSACYETQLACGKVEHVHDATCYDAAASTASTTVSATTSVVNSNIVNAATGAAPPAEELIEDDLVPGAASPESPASGSNGASGSDAAGGDPTQAPQPEQDPLLSDPAYSPQGTQVEDLLPNVQGDQDPAAPDEPGAAEDPASTDQPAEGPAADDPADDPAYQQDPATSGDPDDAAADPADSAASADPANSAPADQPASADSAQAPAQSFTHTLKDQYGATALQIQVDAPEGALPPGTQMRVTPISATDVQAQVEQALAADAQARAQDPNAQLLTAIQAVDITFADPATNAEIEPAIPVVVRLAAPAIQQAAESTQQNDPQIVHIPTNAASPAIQAAAEAAQAAQAAAQEAAATTATTATATGAADDAADAPAAQAAPAQAAPAPNAILKPAQPATADPAVVDPLTKKEIKYRNAHAADDESQIKAPAADELVFDAAEFSIYAIAYTVDFHYQVNGQTYELSMQGGSYTSLGQLLEALGIPQSDAAATQQAAVRDISATQAFLEDVQNVQFTSPDLIYVTKLQAPTTLGQIKQAAGLEPQYSVELANDPDALAQLDATPIAPPDWALVSLKPFTSEETLTITLAQGEQLQIRVTDLQDATTLNQIDTTKKYLIWTEWNKKYYVLKGDGTTATFASKSQLDKLGEEYLWTFAYDQWNGNRALIRPVIAKNKSLSLGWADQPLVQQGENRIAVTPWYGQFILEGWNTTQLSLGKDGKFYGFMWWTDQQYWQQWANEHPRATGFVNISEQTTASAAYFFTVKSADTGMGGVSGWNSYDEQQTKASSYVDITTSGKKNSHQITAVPQSNKYLFDYWDLNGSKLNSYGATINSETLAIPKEGSVLTAHFKKNPNYTPTDEEMKGREIDKETLDKWLNDLKTRQVPLNEDGCTKTAEVYDYDNRIYRVDLTAQSSLATFDGIIDLGLMLDASGSMQFPSKLVEATDVKLGVKSSLSPTNGNGSRPVVANSDGVLLTSLNDDDNTKRNILDTSHDYYFVANRSNTFTVYQLHFQSDAWDSSSNGWGQWVARDASYEKEEDYQRIGWGTTFLNEPATTRYPLYVDGDNGLRRKYYLESSIKGTMTELQNILKNISLAADSSRDPDVKIAYNTFDAGIKSAQIDFKSVKNGIEIDYKTGGGTRQDLALNDKDYGATQFKWENSATRYAVLITDGAPLDSKKWSTAEAADKDVTDAANALKQKLGTDGKLITVGLSMADVTRGSKLLYNIASRDDDDEPLFYSANTGDELKYVLYEIIKTIMEDAIVQGSVTDTVDPAFYPVDKATGKPLANGQKIDLNGNLTTDTSKPYGAVRQNGDGTYTIEWSNQDFTWDGWHGSVYVKAKEDFLGGNAINTNQGKAKTTVDSYRMPDSNTAIPLKQEMCKTYEYDTPRVNVDELALNQNSTEWTVYKGTWVDPETQLKKLFDQVKFNEVVTATQGGAHQVLAGNGSLVYPLVESSQDGRTATGTPETFSVSDVIRAQTGEDLDWTALVNAGDDGITIPYSAYGHENVGNLVIKLTKDHDPAAHAADVVGEPAETYTLTIEYVPDASVLPQNQGGQGTYDYHTGDYGIGLPGNPAGTATSANQHVINVFVRNLLIQKQDMDGHPLAGEARFKLYRLPNTDETATATIKVNGQDVQVVQIGTELVTQNGKGHATDPASDIGFASVENLPIGPGGVYYLVETKAPDGFVALAEPVTLNLTLADAYTNLNTQTITVDQTGGTPYNWAQTVADFKYGNSQSGLTTGDDLRMVVPNNPGRELPHAGGPGTAATTLAGAALVALAPVAYLASRRRARRASRACKGVIR